MGSVCLKNSSRLVERWTLKAKKDHQQKNNEKSAEGSPRLEERGEIFYLSPDFLCLESLSARGSTVL